jgi:hypothetical protein
MKIQNYMKLILFIVLITSTDVEFDFNVTQGDSEFTVHM